MSIFDHLKNPDTKAREQELDNEKALLEAFKLFSKQRDSIVSIQQTEGFKEIIRFFKDEKEICENVFRKGVKPEYIQLMQGKYDVVCKFLDFVKNITAPSKVR